MKLIVFITFLAGFCCFYIYNEFLFYHTLKVYCKKSMGNCSNCACWSCPRKEQIENRLRRLKKFKKHN